ncbi:MAG: nucleotide exchange factor GrpE [Planctomycetota bacterium]|jgi:molecular chaperone GrpE (heat shock protein)
MFRKFTILGSVLLIAGAATLGLVLNDKRKEQRRTADYKLKNESETSKYIERYNEWLQSPPEERAQLPSGLDEDGKTKTNAQLQIEQQERLKADLDKLSADEMDVYPFADVLYGENWQDELAKYKKRKELSELVLSASILCMLTGGAILSLLLLLLTVRLLNKGSSRVTKFAATYLRGREKTEAEQLAQIDANVKAQMKAKAKAERKAEAKAEKLAKAEEKARVKAEAKEKVRAEAEVRTKAKAERKAKAEAEKLAKAEEKAKTKAEAKEKARVEAEAGAKAKAKRKAKAEARAKAKAKRKAKAKVERLAKAEEKARAKAEAKEKIRAEAEARAKAEAKRKAEAEAEKLAKAEEKARATAEAAAKAKAEAEEKMRLQEQQSRVKNHSKVLRDSGWQGFEADSAEQAEKIAVLLSDEKSIDLEESLKAATENVNVSLKLKESLKAQTESLEKQMAEFKEMTQSAQQAAVEQSDPINNTLTELTEQVAAIREYASGQQGRLEKLQDGYDWNIIKTFCLRVIRCIDNLESRIGRLSEQDSKAVHLEEIRDELIFALESSGIEQFKPEINSDYRGQEKYAEAIKEKESCKDSKRKGKIAKVIRPGYQYFISEDNVKVVRPAQVKLFG